MEPIRFTTEDLDALVDRLEACLSKEDFAIIKSMAHAIKTLQLSVNDKASSIKRLLKMVFGSKTEKKKKPKGSKSGSNDKEKKPRKKGHGKRGADEFTGADKVPVPHESLKHKDPCPLCPKGIVYRQKKPGYLITLTGQAPVQATVHELEKLRCNLCGMVFTAQAPGNKTGKDYDASAMAMMALFRYGYGMPWNRLDKLQESLGIPLPASTQWEKTEAAADSIYPVFYELARQAAQGEVLHNDDTTMKVLELLKENKTIDAKGRTGIFTTGIISRISEDRLIALYYTGRKHAGENIAELYKARDPDKPPPKQMCDALSRNHTGEFEVILCNCMTHARRNFVEEADNFPEECDHVIDVIGKVYHHDAITKEQKMTPEQRLAYHQKHSGPLMEELYDWMDNQLKNNLVEPNSGLGKAIAYMIKHWPKLTRFLEVPGAPLDNNICERSLKQCIRHRKNSLFYKTEHGAFIGDMFMSLINTCNLMKINPLDYLTTLIENSSELFKNPALWMPWNYKHAVA